MWMLGFLRSWVLCVAILFSAQTSAQQLSQQLEVVSVSVGAGWATVNTRNSYVDPVVVCTYNILSKTSPNATPRVRNAGATSFQVALQQLSSGYTFVSGKAFCVVSETGSYNLPGGLKYEARRVLSDGTSGNSSPNNWSASRTEEITGSLMQSYSNPVVMGQVMTANDSRPSMFWTFDCVTRGNPPFVNGRACVGKHVGQIGESRSNEMIGYIVAQSGSGSVNDMAFAIARGANSIAGVGNNPPYFYSLTGDFDLGVASQNGENGGQGGWAVLFGADALPSGGIGLAIDEETVVGDKTRTHTNEQVAYWLFKDNQIADITVTKTSALSLDNNDEFYVPQAEVVYKIAIDNVGSKGVDSGGIFILDKLPFSAAIGGGGAAVALYTGDFAGPGNGPVRFVDSGSGLTFVTGSSVRYSDALVEPTSFSDCTYALSGAFDPNVRYICIQPAGAMNAGSLAASSFEISYKVKIE